MIVTAKPTNPAHPPASRGARGTAPAGKNAFPKSARLLKHAGFQHVYETGRKHFSATMTFFYVLRAEGENLPKDNAPSSSPSFGDRVGSAVQVGITVGRALGGAVDRNRIKRRMRHCVRHELATLREALTARGVSAEIVINPKKLALTADIAKLRAEVERGFGIIATANVIAARAAQPGAAVPQGLSQKTGDARSK